MTRGLHAMACALALAGCSVLIDPDEARLGDGQDDIDSGPGGSPDAGTTPDDAGPDAIDAPAGCTGGPRCDGDVWVRCVSGVESRLDCATRESFCDVDRCVPYVCKPDSRECSDDLRELLVCSARGDVVTRQPCDVTCDPNRGVCIDVTPRCFGLPRISIGASEDFDICQFADDSAPQIDNLECRADPGESTPDRAFVLTLLQETALVVELTDIDSSVEIDTIVYVRSDCDDPSTQIACDDDVPCDMSTVPGQDRCSGNEEVRQSRLSTTLAPGTYYVIADAFRYVGHNCGRVRLRVTAAADTRP